MALVNGIDSLLKHLVSGEVPWAVSVGITAMLEIVATAIIVRIVSYALRSFLRHDSVPIPSSSIFVNIARVSLWAICVCVVLASCLGIDVSGAIAALGVGGIALSLGFKDTISNVIGGVQVSVMGLVAPGDHIRVGTSQGVVEDVTWRQTVVRSAEGQQIYIPNSIINTAALEKLPAAGLVKIGVVANGPASCLDESARAMADAARRAARGVDELLGDPKVSFSEVVEGGVKGSVLFEVASPNRAAEARDAVVRAIAPFARPVAGGSDGDADSGADRPDAGRAGGQGV
ncbi:mechanosensitive ion channel family protein [Berryella intestinalis]|uniref:mechanosensitive ion channel family protein n=1 Tax=Berryella intestinalis TaxID=1531429 RepID=UPI00068A68C5|nr:mechanosensitive ion channel domain-containing protein [Berryella intestinalis]